MPKYQITIREIESQDYVFLVEAPDEQTAIELAEEVELPDLAGIPEGVLSVHKGFYDADLHVESVEEVD